MFSKIKAKIAIVVTFFMIVSPLCSVFAWTNQSPANQNHRNRQNTQSVTVAPATQTPEATPEATAPTAPTDNALVTDTTAGPVDPGLQTVPATTDSLTVPATDNSLAPTDASGTNPDQNVINSTTGADSNNTAQNTTGQSTTNVDSSNNADVSNNIQNTANTGGNNANYNTGSGSVVTGDSNLVLSIVNLINTTFVALPDGQIKFLFQNIAGDLFGNYIIDPNSGEAYSLTGSRLDVGNSNTGAGSTNKAIVNTGSSTDISNTSSANLANTFNLLANTGNNSSSYNTGNGSVATGDANVSLNLLNFVNSNFTATSLGMVGVINIFGNWTGNLVIPQSLFDSSASCGINPCTNINVGNSQTGADSISKASAAVSNLVDVNNDNNADIANNLNIQSGTGNNVSSYDTGSGTTTTGNINDKVDVSNQANQTAVGDFVFLAFVNVMGAWNGSNLLLPFLTTLAPSSSGNSQINVGNNQTGAGSTNTAKEAENNSTTINNNNNSQIANNINIITNTGGNSAGYNTGDGSVSTGNANVLANLLNFSNINLTAKKFVFLIVNVFGDWKGNIELEKTAENTSAASSVNNIVGGQMSSDTNIINLPVESSVVTAGPVKTSQSISSTTADLDNQNKDIKLAAANFGQNTSLQLPIFTRTEPNFFFGHLKEIMAMFVILYLSFLSVYFKRRKNKVAKN